MTNVDRRKLVVWGASAPLWAPGAAPASSQEGLRGMLVINALGGLDDPNRRQIVTRPKDTATPTDAPVLDARIFQDLKASGLTAVNITLGYVSGSEDPVAYTLRSIDAWLGVMQQHADDLLLVRAADDLLKARAENKVGVIFGFQNAVQVADAPQRVDQFGDLGVRVVQLTYNPRNPLGDGSMAAENRGLTAIGREVVDRLNARKLMVDLSHSGERTCLDAIAASKAPISINHTGCRALCDLPRNKTDVELRGVAERGGFVGIYFMPFLAADGHPTAADVVAHIEHALQVCGEDHVGIGTDGSVTGIDDLEAYKGALAREVAARQKAGVGATGERADTYPFVVDLRGAGQFRRLADLLRARGHREGRIEKVMGRNFLRFARDVWG
jgi:membrane dipeptidase